MWIYNRSYYYIQCAVSNNVRILVPGDDTETLSSLSKVILPIISEDNDYGLMYKECT